MQPDKWKEFVREERMRNETYKEFKFYDVKGSCGMKQRSWLDNVFFRIFLMFCIAVLFGVLPAWTLAA